MAAIPARLRSTQPLSPIPASPRRRMARAPVNSDRSVENRVAFSTEGVTPIAWTRLRRCPPYGFAPNASGARIAPFRRASASVVEWVEPHGCGERSSGPWTAHLDRPRNGAGVSGPAAQRRAA